MAKLLTFCCAALLLAPSEAGAEEPRAGKKPRPAGDYETFHKGYGLARGMYQGEARLSVDKSVLQPGEEYRLTLTFENTSDQAYDIFNPSLSIDVTMTAALAIYDGERRFVGDLLASWGGRAVGGNLPFGTWCRVAAGEKRSLSVERSAGVVGGTRFTEPTHHGLPPGRYFIQAVYLDRFASSCPWYSPAGPCGALNGIQDESGEVRMPSKALQDLEQSKPQLIAQLLDRWKERYPGRELFRSNVVEITLLPRPLEAPKPGLR